VPVDLLTSLKLVAEASMDSESSSRLFFYRTKQNKTEANIMSISGSSKSIKPRKRRRINPISEITEIPLVPTSEAQKMVHVTPTKPILHQKSMSVELKRLTVVNREEASEQISKALILNPDKAENKLRVLVVASSMNGQGKTTIGYEFRKIMEKKGYWQKLESEYKEDPSKVEVLENLKKAIYIYVDCRKISNYSTLPLEKALVNIVRDTLSQESVDDHENNLSRIPENMKSTVKQWSNRENFNSFEHLYSFLRASDRNHGYLFHLDEVDAIEPLESALNKFSPEEKVQECLEPYYKLWNQVTMVVHNSLIASDLASLGYKSLSNRNRYMWLLTFFSSLSK
jgi:hypothetical protein